jgi:hypothetical protein
MPYSLAGRRGAKILWTSWPHPWPPSIPRDRYSVEEAALQPETVQKRQRCADGKYSPLGYWALEAFPCQPLGRHGLEKRVTRS